MSDVRWTQPMSANPTSHPPPPDPQAGLPKLPPHGEITPEAITAFWKYLQDGGVAFSDPRLRPRVWAAYMREFTVDDLRCLAKKARTAGILPPLEACLARMAEGKAAASRSAYLGRQALTTTGATPEAAPSSARPADNSDPKYSSPPSPPEAEQDASP